MTKISNQYSLTNILTADLANSRLGINNVSPTVALDVTGAGKFSGVSTFLTTVTLGTGTASGGLLRINQPTNDILGGIVCQSNGGANGGMFHNTTSLVIREGGINTMYFAAGNVGIGTSSPNIVGFTGPVLTVNGSGNYQGFEVATGGVSRFIMASQGTIGFLSTRQAGMDIVFEAGAASEKMRITSAGLVLIGRTSASIMSASGLAVDNNIVSCEGAAGLFTQNRASTNFFGVYANVNFIVYNSNVGTIGTFNATSGSYAGVSDVNKKKDFEQSQIGLNEVLRLKPTLYRMKAGSNTEDKQLGFIAQEVKEFIPQAYSETGEGDDKFIGLTEMPIIAALTKAIQELSAKVSLLENK